jgi:two-component system, NarL family, invasion response regulator UvrY
MIEERYAMRVLKAGAACYLTREIADDELITALRKVAAGGKYVSPTLAERLADEIDVGIDPPRTSGCRIVSTRSCA